MVTALIHSRRDPAGVAIRKAMDDLIGQEEEDTWPLLQEGHLFHETDGRLIHEDHLDESVKADRIIFLSRHSSVNPEPVLTVHVTGNFSEAAYGGAPDELSAADPGMMQAVLQNLIRYAPDGYRAGYEITHHGPTDLTTPSFFVEIGSTEKEWRDTEAAEAVARSVLSAVPGDFLPLIGVGGTHYAIRQTVIASETRGAFGHIAHSREAGTMTADRVRRMIGMTGAVAGYIDRKAVSTKEFDLIARLFEELQLPLVTEGMLHEMGSVPWKTWRQATTLASGIAQAPVLKNHGMERDCALSVIRINEELLNEALRCGKEEFITALDTITPSFRIVSGGTVALPAFIGCRESEAQLASDLITLCVQQITKHSHAVVEGDRLIISRERFDPEKARKLGVPEGPLFGRLASGQAVDVGGRVISADMVTTHVLQEITIPGLERIT
ncbi:MAG: D-tyrosyl-tRNA(Tyr) deacylase [Methanomicrobiales archaeon 53_19]|jgi:D-aminoacyl-tRNA deacylase|uniref:D-aminoacyl-tRNA deacylase n=1 Tax=Methanocalculus sp. TaxID=2004547 RepID=UPI000749157B|nr:D-aminoacyl-tRNA deacylase [Methanocalculus sp.]KUK69443.1 MAG: D-tyrosyl-tRNA(Tyr) deacylase [Methanocalculus sp. 52_23]KUL03311.1 MAG: D-tyrosyl-tRNA(Tyr) deacylase [Methanomicrobiales archaeon 53_19]HIJ07062.1 D-tyrosyl-tRNA(Tyr) deacylase [Methanocalculus sp.]